MSQIGTVTATEGLNVRSGPGTEHARLGALSHRDKVVLHELDGDWWSADTRFGRGFVHAAFVEIEETQTYTCVSGDTLIAIGRRFDCDFRQIATLNGLVEPFQIQVGQVLMIPRGGVSPVTFTTTISLLNPMEFTGETKVTSSSLQGHHRPYLGSSSCDLDIRGASSPGTRVRFNLTGPEGQELRGVVGELGLACRSQRIEDGGRTVKVTIQRRMNGGEWTDTGAWVLYAHLDPVLVSTREVLSPGTVVGAMGPASGPEYNSSCAQGSHVHVEATQSRCVVNEGAVIRNAPIITLDV